MSSWSKLVRGYGFLMLTALFLLAGGNAFAAQAQDKFDLEIKRDTPDPDRPNMVRILVMIRDANTGKVPPEKRLEKVAVNAFAEPEGGGAQTDVNGCVRRTSIEGGAKRGLHDCAVFVEQGGEWEFTVVINTLASERAVDNEEPGASLVQLASQTKTFKVNAPKLEGFNQERESIEASADEIALLQIHVIAVLAWVASAALLSIIALPPLRRLVSDRAMTVLEVRCRTLISSLGATCVLIIVTGSFMLAFQLPYDFPTSMDAAKDVFGLPFGQGYFGALAVKLFTFVVMVGATVVIAIAASKRARIPSALEQRDEDADDTIDDADPWHASSRGQVITGGTAIAQRKRSPADMHRQLDTAPAMVAAVFFAVGLAITGFCVTLLKYFHELIEAIKAFI